MCELKGYHKKQTILLSLFGNRTLYLNTYVLYIPIIFAMHQIVAVSVVITTLSILSRRPATTLDTLQKKQKEIEEENQKKKVLLQQVLAERYCVCLQFI